MSFLLTYQICVIKVTEHDIFSYFNSPNIGLKKKKT